MASSTPVSHKNTDAVCPPGDHHAHCPGDRADRAPGRPPLSHDAIVIKEMGTSGSLDYKNLEKNIEARMDQIEKLLKQLTISRVATPRIKNPFSSVIAPTAKEHDEGLDLDPFGNDEYFLPSGLLEDEPKEASGYEQNEERSGAENEEYIVTDGAPLNVEIAHGKHNMLTHFPMDPNCPVCRNSKIQRAPHISSKRKADRYEKEAIESVGEITADPAIMGSGETCRNGDQVCLVILDRFTGWMSAYPSKTKDAESVADGFQKCFGQNQNEMKRVYTDGSLEFKKGLRLIHVPHDASLPYDPQSNGVAENSIRRFKEGTRCLLVQSGLSPMWWAEAARCFCEYRSVSDFYQQEGTPYYRRHKRFHNGPTIPLGAAVRYLPHGNSETEQHTLAAKTHLGLFMGPEFNSKQLYVGNCFIIDVEQFGLAMHADEVHLQRIKSKEVISCAWPDPFFPAELGIGLNVQGDFLFPCALGILGQPDDDSPGKRHAVKRPPPYQNIVPNLGENLDADQSEVKDEVEDEAQDACDDHRWELRGDYLVRIHSKPRKALFIPDSTCLLQDNWLDLYRKTKTSLPDPPEKQYRDMGPQSTPKGNECPLDW